jgi:hypothetical protein
MRLGSVFAWGRLVSKLATITTVIIGMGIATGNVTITAIGNA